MEHRVSFFSDNLPKRYYNNPPGGGIVFLIQIFSLKHNAHRPPPPAALRHMGDNFSCSIQTLIRFLLPVLFEVSPSWNGFLLSFQTSFNQSFLSFLWSTEHVRERGVAQSALGWGRCCISMETGCLLSPLQLICGLLRVSMSVRTAATPQRCGVNVTQKTLEFFTRWSKHTRNLFSCVTEILKQILASEHKPVRE